MNDLVVKNVDVMGDSIMAAQDNKGVVWVGVRWMCQGLGMTEGQWKRQITNIQSDEILSSSGSNLNLNKGSGERDIYCLKLDYVPLWLAKIRITPKIKKENPNLAEKLLEYQLKAKDILADAFMPNRDFPKTTEGQIQLLAQGYMEMGKRVDEVKSEVDTVKSDLESLKMDLPILPIEADRITIAARRRGTEVLGGKQSAAYKNRTLRQRVYTNLYSNLKYNFKVSSYKSIKRSQTDKAVEIIERYEPPVFLAERIAAENAQQKLEV